MSTKDITDLQVIAACRDGYPTSVMFLRDVTGQPLKVCICAMERACERGLIECGSSIWYAWPTHKGLSLLANGMTR